MFQVTANPLSGGDPGQARSVTRYTSNQGDENKSGGGGGSGGQGKTSTVQSIGNAGGGESVGGGEKDDLSEQLGRTFSSASQDGKIVDHGKGHSLGTVNK
jgi:hypothetical protein